MTTTKDERLAIRVTRDQLELIREAATLEGRSVSDFATSTLTAHANEVLADQRVFRLTGAQWDELVAMLDRPPVIRPNLADAMRLHRKHVK
jgi:uncharacterized protein (DUF1778 family)